MDMDTDSDFGSQFYWIWILLTLALWKYFSNLYFYLSTINCDVIFTVM